MKLSCSTKTTGQLKWMSRMYVCLYREYEIIWLPKISLNSSPSLWICVWTHFFWHSNRPTVYKVPTCRISRCYLLLEAFLFSCLRCSFFVWNRLVFYFYRVPLHSILLRTQNFVVVNVYFPLFLKILFRRGHVMFSRHRRHPAHRRRQQYWKRQPGDLKGERIAF